MGPSRSQYLHPGPISLRFTGPLSRPNLTLDDATFSTPTSAQTRRGPHRGIPLDTKIVTHVDETTTTTKAVPVGCITAFHFLHHCFPVRLPRRPRIHHRHSAAPSTTAITPRSRKASSYSHLYIRGTGHHGNSSAHHTCGHTGNSKPVSELSVLLKQVRMNVSGIC